MHFSVNDIDEGFPASYRKVGPQGEVLVLGDRHSLWSTVQLEPRDGMLLVVVEGELVDVPEVAGVLGEEQAAKVHSICRIEKK